jgi:hypothetical protein
MNVRPTESHEKMLAEKAEQRKAIRVVIAPILGWGGAISVSRHGEPVSRMVRDRRCNRVRGRLLSAARGRRWPLGGERRGSREGSVVLVNKKISGILGSLNLYSRVAQAPRGTGGCGWRGGGPGL